MRIFQALNNEVLIINDQIQYSDTVENFMRDSGGVQAIPEKVIYNEEQKCCIVNRGEEDKWLDYPDATFDGYIASVSKYIAMKEKREYTPPTLDELKQQALNYQYCLYVDKRDANVVVDGMGFATNDSGQRDWQIALTLMGDSSQYKVYDKNGKNEKLATVTRAQMLQAGNTARVQQITAYNDFVAVRDAIKNCKSTDELQAFLPQEIAEKGAS